MQIYDLSNSPLVPVSSPNLPSESKVNALGIGILGESFPPENGALCTFSAQPNPEIEAPALEKDSLESSDIEEEEEEEDGDLIEESIENGSVVGDLSAGSGDEEDKREEDPDWQIASDI